MPSAKAKPDQLIHDFFEERARAGDGAYAIAYAILNLTEAQIHTARAINKLGVADASTHFGAIESLSMEIVKAGTSIAEAVQGAGGEIAAALTADDRE